MAVRRWFVGAVVWLLAATQSVAEMRPVAPHWSFKLPSFSPPPRTSDTTWARNGLDSCILAGLEGRGLHPAPAADRRTWLRRATLTLTGLPPSSRDLAEFLGDHRVDAFERRVEALLQSPRYGERWAQHWLDVVRYADTDGFEVNTERKNAWPYRDYVIRALNEDTPYSQFILDQLAGDVVGVDPATGFLVTAAALLPGQIGADDASKRLARQDSLSEIVDSTGQAFLGLTIGCARCHDHKFDPVSQVDFYSIQAFFAGVRYGERPNRSPEVEARQRESERLQGLAKRVERQLESYEPLAQSAPGPLLRPPVNPRRTIDRFAPVVAKKVRFTIDACTSLAPCIDELEVYTEGLDSRNRALASEGTKASASGTIPDSTHHRLEHVNDGQYGNSRSWISNEEGRGWITLEFAQPCRIDRVVWGRDREEKYADRLPVKYRIEVADDAGVWRVVASSVDRREYAPGRKDPEIPIASLLDPNEAREATKLLAARKDLDSRISALQDERMVFAGVFSKADVTYLLHRGDPEQPREPVAPAVLRALGGVKLPEETGDPSRRVALAHWISNPLNPLTARVMVNRIWQGHFGLGLVETANDFGRQGARPSHPELLDWLATEFIRSGWSLKHMHRLILLSATFRQSSRLDPRAHAIDSANRLLWRYPSRRLEAETIRDSMLAVSGRLNLKMGGPGFNLFGSRGGLSGFPPIESFSGDGLRRMIYAHKVRMERESVFGAFDCPDAGQSAPRRRQSTTPIQALNLFNSRFTLEESDAFAARVVADAGSGADSARRIRRIYELGLGRDPEPAELEEAVQVEREHGLPTVCRALFNSNEFLFLP